MPIRDRIIEVLFQLKDQFSKPSKQIKGAYREIGDAADKAESRVARAGKSIRRAFTGMGARIGALFAAGGVAAGLQQLDQFADKLDRLQKTATKLNTTTEELSKLGFAAEQTGIDVRTLQTALQRLNRRTSEAAAGYGVAKKALEELGLSAEALNQLTVDEQFKQIADAMQGVELQADKVRLTVALFDQEAAGLVNTLAGGRESLDAYGDELERIGGVIATDAAKAAERYNDSLLRLEKHFEAIGNKYGPKVLDFFNRLFHQTGLGAADLQEVNREIEHLQDLISRADSGELGAMFRVNFATDDLRQRLADLLVQQEQLLKQGEEQKAASEQRDAARADQARAAELAKTQKHVDAIQKEFDKLVEGPKKTQKAADELNLIDLSKPISDAMSAFAQGDYDAAIAQARSAGEMLEQMRESGQYADIVLTGMAQRIRDIAVDSAKAKGGVNLEVSVDTVTLEAVQKTLDGLAAPITVPVRLESPAGTAEIEWESAKRGSRL